MTPPLPARDPLHEITAALNADPFADPVNYGGGSLPRASARALERHLLHARRGRVVA